MRTRAFMPTVGAAAFASLLLMPVISYAECVENPPASGTYICDADDPTGLQIPTEDNVSVTVNQAVTVTNPGGTAIAVGETSSVAVGGGFVGNDLNTLVGVSAGAGSTVDITQVLDSVGVVEGAGGNGTAVEFRTPVSGDPAGLTNILSNGGIIDGNVLVSGDVNTQIVNDGTINGNIDLSGGTNQSTVNGTLNGDLASGSGNDTVILGNGGQITGTVSNGDGDNSTSLASFAVISGSVSGGAGNDTVTVSESATILGGLSLGDGTNTISSAGDIIGGIDVGAGNDTIDITVTGEIDGNVEVGAGTNTISFVTDSSIVTMGTLNANPAGDSTLNLGGDEASNTYDIATTNFNALNKNGTGEWILDSADNTFSDGININAGTLTVTGANRLGDSDIVNQGALTIIEVEPTSTGSHAGNISGSGGLQKRGDGETTLSGTNTYQGATVVENGTLILSGGSAISDQGDVIVGTTGVLVFDTAETVGSLAVEAGSTSGLILNADLTTGANNLDSVIAGDIDGVGGITKMGSGALTLSGTNLNTGGLSIMEGSVILEGGNAIEFTTDVAVAAPANLIVTTSENIDMLTGTGGVQVGTELGIGANNSDAQFDGIISGTGGLLKLGTGTLTLNGASTYAGGTEISDGTLIVMGSVAGDLLIEVGATLAGTGNIQGSVDAQGTTSPGTSQGTLTVGGDFVFGSQAVFEAELDNDGSDVLNVGGNAGPRGTMALTADRDFYDDGNVYNVIDAGQIISASTFDTVTGENINLFVDLATSYTVDTVSLTTDRRSYESAAVTSSQADVARALDERVADGGISGDTEELLTSIDYLPNDAAAAAAFGSIGPADYSAMVGGVIVAGDAFADTVKRQLRSRLPESRRAWLQIYGIGSEVDSGNNGVGYDAEGSGMTLGIDFNVGQSGTLGFAGGYSSLDVEPDSISDGNQDGYQFGAYYGTDFNKLALDVLAFYAKGDNDFDRGIMVGDETGVASAITDSSEARASAYLTYKLGNFAPYGGLEYSAIKVDGFTETGAGVLNLAVADIEADRILGELGVRYISDRDGIRPVGYLGYRYDFKDEDVAIDAVLLGENVRVDGGTIERGSAVFGFGVESGSETLNLLAVYDGKYADGFQSHQISLGFEWKF